MKLTFQHLEPNAQFYMEETKNRPRGGPYVKLSATRYIDPAKDNAIKRILFTDTVVSRIV